MATFGSITRGPRARKRIVLPLQGATTNAETGAWEGDVVELDVCGLGPHDQTDVARSARAFAIAHGLEDPKDGDDLYDWGKTLYTLLATCLDKDSPADAPKPFFDGGFEQLHTTKLLLPEHIGYLYEQQQAWQDECAPGIKTMSQTQFLAAVVKVAGGDITFFANARPGMRWSFTHTLAALQLDSLTRKSPSTSPSDSPSETPN
jgi:hypothetical protein